MHTMYIMYIHKYKVNWYYTAIILPISKKYRKWEW